MKYRVILLAVAAVLLAGNASAAWNWLFGGSTNETNSAGKEQPRISTLMEPASLLIDEATDLLNDGKTDEAVEKYREALRALERIEAENPERAATPEFQSVRNKRAYVDAQLNAILLEEARMNAKAVAVTDTTELEKALAKKRAKAQAEKSERAKQIADAAVGKPKLEKQIDTYMEGSRARDKKLQRAAESAKFERESEEKIEELLEDDPDSRKARLMRAGLELYRKNYGTARKDVEDLLYKNPKDISALNLMAAIETATGDYEAAEKTLAKAIRTNEDDYHAYYNLAKLLVRRGGEKNLAQARKFYKTGRKSKKMGGPGGPVDANLERMLEE